MMTAPFLFEIALVTIPAGGHQNETICGWDRSGSIDLVNIREREYGIGK
jgi:hypothetical protein